MMKHIVAAPVSVRRLVPWFLLPLNQHLFPLPLHDGRDLPHKISGGRARLRPGAHPLKAARRSAGALRQVTARVPFGSPLAESIAGLACSQE